VTNTPRTGRATTSAPTTEYAWFGALCDDDYEQLGVAAPHLASSVTHCLDIVRAAEDAGFDNILLPSGYALGIDAVTFAAAASQHTSRIRLLVAVRIGEMVVPQLARQLATLQHMLGDRLTINIISSEVPGETLAGGPRYRRTIEHMNALRTLLDGQRLEANGDWVDLRLDPPRIATTIGGCPPMYFGGLSDEARECAAQAADVYLMWPDTIEATAATIADLRQRAAGTGRRLRFGFRVHVIVRETEVAARAAAEHLVDALDDEIGRQIRARSLDSQSVGVRRQAELRDTAGDDGYVSRHLWTGIGRARSGCGAAIVGDPGQVADTLASYAALGIDSFILSGYPHLDECRRFSDLVMPLLRVQSRA
jgi:alkanesulfonate monooxygenase